MKIKTIKNRYGSFTVYGTDEWFSRSTLPLANAEHEKPIVRYMEKNKNKYDTLIDVGANYGYFSVIGAQLFKDVIAVEAHPLRYGFLLWNIRKYDNIYSMRSYIGDSVSTPKTDDDPMAMVSNRDTKELNVPIVDLDSIINIFAPPDKKILIKIDVEGNELGVINSASMALGKDNIDWIVEIHKFRGIKEKQVFDFFKGYKKKKLMGGNKISHYLFTKEGKNG